MQDKKLPFQIIHRFIQLVKLTHRSQRVRKSSNMFNNDELVIISHLEQAATDLRCANPKVITQAKKILSESSFVPRRFKRYLLGCLELLLIEVKARRKNPAVYDFLYNDGELWYFHNRSELPKEIVKETELHLIELYLAFGNPYQSPEEAQKEEKEFEEIIAHSEKRPLSVEAFIREKVWQLPDHERKDFLRSKKVKHWIAEWHDEYCKVHASAKMDSFQNRVYEVRKELKERIKKNQNGR
jgi:hypothetical protein